MGREAECACVWGAVEIQVKALLESKEMILRGGIRRHLPFVALEQVQAEGEKLTFRYSGERVALMLGESRAAKWATAIQTPPPSLARKLGIAAGTTVLLLGEMDDPELETALAEANIVSAGVAGPATPMKRIPFIIARVDTLESLAAVLKQVRIHLSNGAALWVIYPKGRGHSLGEVAVLAMGREAGLTDTKVAAVSTRLTGLRFIARKQ